MSHLPPEIEPFLNFFRLPQDHDFSGHLPDAISQVHRLILIATHPEKTEGDEEDFSAGADLFSSPFSNIERPKDSLSEAARRAAIIESINATLGSDFRFHVDSSDQVHITIRSETYNLFPFFIRKQENIFWLSRCHSGIVSYSDSLGETFTVECGTSAYQEMIEGFMQRGSYRILIGILSDLPETYRKGLENRIYSAHCFLACENYKSKRYHEAIAEFEKALKIKSNIPQLYYNLALSYARVKSYRTAIQLMNKLNRVKPGQSKTYELLGDFYTQLGDWDRALSLYQRGQQFAENKLTLNAKIRRVDERAPKFKTADKKEREEEKEERFTIQSCLLDLTLEAEAGRFQAVQGREKELLQMEEILACQAKKNVLILGEPGVGKTALVYELAYRIASGTVSPRFQNKKLVRLNVGALLAGAKFRGQFEERLMQLVREIKRLNCLLFVDDIHQIVAGGSGKATSTEASQFIKPALMNDEIQIIGAANFEDFRNSIEKDSSFLRCFQIVKLEEPDNETLLKILAAYRTQLEDYHHVLIQEECLHTVLLWVKVLLRERALPDKALDILDRTAARVSIQEKTAVVASENVLETISEISNVPLNRMSVSETAHYRNIENFLSRRVIGQKNAVSTVSRVLCTSKLRMTLNPSRPKGIFLFVGPTGVGKTELAKAMATFLFGDEEKIVRIDMSEYMERYSASRLIGTSPGYVGYYDQNQLVDKIRSNPYSLILLDEIEKADSQLLSIFLQVFDAGRLTDGKGKSAYFDNSTIVMTSNIGTHLFAQNKLGYGPDQKDGHVTRSDLMKEVKRFFQPEFLNRIDEIVFFQPLIIADVREIATLKLSSFLEHLNQQNKQLELDENTLLRLCRIGYDYEYGARNLERVLRRHLLDKIAQLALTDEWHTIKKISAQWQNDEIVLKIHDGSGLQELINRSVEEHDYLEDKR